MPITRIGICGAEVADEVEPAGPDERIQACAQNSRIFGSSALILRGVNIRASSLRWMSWIGGSSKISAPGGISMLALISSMIAPRAELNVSWSTSALLTSANRLNA